MKLSTGVFTALLAAALASATPTRIVILSEPIHYNKELPPLPFEAAVVPGTAHREMRRPCPAHSKSISIANAFRQALGLDLISTADTVAVVPTSNVSAPPTRISFDAVTMSGYTKGGDRIKLVNPHHHKVDTKSVVDRLHNVLVALGPWKGRVVAFVFGCGIGAILRFFFLIGLLSYRAIARSRQTRVVDYYLVSGDQPIDNPPVYDLDVKDVVFDASEQSK